jgi:hypothetical protein
MSQSYDPAEVEGLTEAYKLIERLQGQTINLDPVWRKLFHAKEYIVKRQNEVLAATLNPEVQ